MVLLVRRLIMAYLRIIRTMAKRKDVLKRFGIRLRELRKDAGFTQESLAQASGIDRSYCGGLERGERNVALKNLEKLADALGLTLSELLEEV